MAARKRRYVNTVFDRALNSFRNMAGLVWIDDGDRRVVESGVESERRVSRRSQFVKE